MPNLHAAGEKLQAAVIPAATEFLIALKRGEVVVSEIFSAASPPIGHNLMTNEVGLYLSEHDRVFFWKAADCSLGLPQIKDIIVDQSDMSEWRVVQGPAEAAWQWHGQTKTMVQVFSKQDTLG